MSKNKFERFEKVYVYRQLSHFVSNSDWGEKEVYDGLEKLDGIGIIVDYEESGKTSYWYDVLYGGQIITLCERHLGKVSKSTNFERFFEEILLLYKTLDFLLSCGTMEEIREVGTLYNRAVMETEYPSRTRAMVLSRLKGQY